MSSGASSPAGSPNLSGLSSLFATPHSETVSLTESRGNASGSPASHRSWLHSGRREKSPQCEKKRRKSDVDWERARSKVREAVGIIIPIASEAISAVPVPGLAAAVKILESIWNSLEDVETNRWACLRLTERCAYLLRSIHTIVSESGSEVVRELTHALNKIEQSFSDIEKLIKGLADMTFLKQFLTKDHILREIDQYNRIVGDCVELFSVTTQVHILGALKNPAGQMTPLLLAHQSDPPSHVSYETLEPLDLGIDAIDISSMEDTSSHHASVREAQEKENEGDRARDMEDLWRILQMALNAPSHLEVTRILRIAKPDMPAAIKELLRELERYQNEEPRNVASESPSPRIRALTWPLDGVPERQATLLRRQFLEMYLEALKRTSKQHDIPTTPTRISGMFRRRSSTKIQIQSPSENDVSTSEFSDTAFTEPDQTHDQLLTDTGSFKPRSPTANISRQDLDPALERPGDSLEGATELRYRMSLSHAFHHLGVSLPLWTPTPVEVGAVGYLLKPAGNFRTLFDSRNPPTTSHIPPLEATILAEKRPQGHGMKARGMKIMDKLTFGTSSSGMRRTYTILASGETAHLIAEGTKHEYFKHLDAPKRWFRTNVDAIQNIYPEYLKEELFLGG
ncbi:hypothetical protein DFH07DRAFT_990396 [Mycena maculata]|uniref:Mixed lineage kinase domain-containing protein n=1 Tax=Mycena maculata TaxID=230809 RepID=A0AAD7I1V5_9AGAR|nr:hypothetical protein DFH07DRAFT_990396 [Mycena maculata]